MNPIKFVVRKEHDDLQLTLCVASLLVDFNLPREILLELSIRGQFEFNDRLVGSAP